MAEDHLKAYPVDRVAAWYRRLAEAWSKNVPDLQPSLAGAFLRTWVDNRNPRAKIEFDAPPHLKSNSAVRTVQVFHRKVFLTNKKARISGGTEQWAGVVPRIQGVPGIPQVGYEGLLSLEYQSLVTSRPTSGQSPRFSGPARVASGTSSGRCAGSSSKAKCR